VASGSYPRRPADDVFAIKPPPIQEYIGELDIVYKGGEPNANANFKIGSLLEEFAKIGKK